MQLGGQRRSLTGTAAAIRALTWRGALLGMRLFARRASSGGQPATASAGAASVMTRH